MVGTSDFVRSIRPVAAHPVPHLRARHDSRPGPADVDGRPAAILVVVGAAPRLVSLVARCPPPFAPDRERRAETMPTQAMDQSRRSRIRRVCQPVVHNRRSELGGKARADMSLWISPRHQPASLVRAATSASAADHAAMSMRRRRPSDPSSAQMGASLSCRTFPRWKAGLVRRGKGTSPALGFLAAPCAVEALIPVLANAKWPALGPARGPAYDVLGSPLGPTAALPQLTPPERAVRARAPGPS